MLFIDDGSKDKTLPILQKLAEENKKVKVISFAVRFRPWAEPGGRIATNATTFNRELLIVEKQADGKQTTTNIRLLTKEGEIEELARLLGADVLSEAALSNAKEMKNEAAKIKQS